MLIIINNRNFRIRIMEGISHAEHEIVLALEVLELVADVEV